MGDDMHDRPQIIRVPVDSQLIMDQCLMDHVSEGQMILDLDGLIEA
jgi:hypothetical protein